MRRDKRLNRCWSLLKPGLEKTHSQANSEKLTGTFIFYKCILYEMKYFLESDVDKNLHHWAASTPTHSQGMRLNTFQLLFFLGFLPQFSHGFLYFSWYSIHEYLDIVRTDEVSLTLETDPLFFLLLNCSDMIRGPGISKQSNMIMQIIIQNLFNKLSIYKTNM